MDTGTLTFFAIVAVVALIAIGTLRDWIRAGREERESYEAKRLEQVRREFRYEQLQQEIVRLKEEITRLERETRRLEREVDRLKQELAQAYAELRRHGIVLSINQSQIGQGADVGQTATGKDIEQEGAT